jgi:hypothetical protein
MQKSMAVGAQTQYGKTLSSSGKSIDQTGQWATAPPAKGGGGLELPPRQELALGFQTFNGTATGKNSNTGSNFAKTDNDSNFMKTAGPPQLSATKPLAVSFAGNSNGSRPPLKASLKAPLSTQNRNRTNDLEGAYLDEGAAFGSYGVPDKLGYRADSHSGSKNNNNNSGPGSGSGGGGRNGAKLALPRLGLSAETKRANMPVGNLFERDSPRAKGTLRSFLRHFMEEGGVKLKTDIDLGKHALSTGEPISNAWIQELCVMQPDLKRLGLAEGFEVTDVGLWAIARHCPHIEALDLSKCSAISKVGLRSLSLRCQGLEELKFDHCTHGIRATPLHVPLLFSLYPSLKLLVSRGLRLSLGLRRPIRTLTPVSLNLKFLSYSIRVRAFSTQWTIRACAQLRLVAATYAICPWSTATQSPTPESQKSPNAALS